VRLPRLAGPNRIYHGYLVAFVAFLSTGLSVGMTQYAFGEFATPLRDEFGWTNAQLYRSLTLSLVSGLVAPLAGRLIDRIGIRPVMFGSLLLIATGFALRPLISELWHWYLFSAIVYAGFPGATIMPAGKLVGLWFPVTRGRVMGAVTAGNNFGGLTMAPLAAVLIAFISWQGAYITFAITMAVLAVVAWLIVREDIESVDAEMRRVGRFDGNVTARAAARAGITMRAAMRTPQFWLITLALVCATFTYQGVLTQLRQHFEESGLAPAVATAGLSVIAGMGIGSKLAFGRASESITARYSMAISVGLQAIGVSLMIVPGNAAVMWLGIIVFGLGFGGLGALIVLVVQEAFGLREFGSIIGAIQVAQIASQAGGPELAGRTRDATGSFDLAFMVVIALFLMGIAALLLARPLKWEQTEEPRPQPSPAKLSS